MTKSHLFTVLCLIIFIAPYLLVFALNVLFNLQLDYTFQTWAAAMILLLAFGASSTKK